jgi:hypothetical protein
MRAISLTCTTARALLQKPPMPIRRAALAAVLLALVPACDEDRADINPDPPLSDVVAAGRYELTMHFHDFLPLQALPDAALDSVGLLWQLHEKPGSTLIARLDDAGDPIVGEVLGQVPDALRDQVPGWMDDAILTAVYGDQPVAVRLGAIYTMADSALEGFDIDSTLTLGDDPVHQLRTIHFAFGDRDIAVPFPDDARARARCQTTRDEWAQLHLEDHHFGLDYGALFDRALDQALVETYGADVRGTLGMLVDCDAVAANVAARCVSGECVGHESELRALCVAGLDATAAELHTLARSIGIVRLELTLGRAWLDDGVPADGVGDDLRAGFFNAYLVPPGKNGQLVLNDLSGRAIR